MRFANPDPAHRPHRLGAVLKWALWDRLSGRRRIAPPGPPAPRVEPDRDLIADPGGPSRLTWIGHASFLGSLGGASFLVDPIFSRRVGVLYPRHGRPGLAPAELPPLEALLVSHSHYDHLDAASVRALPTAVPAVVPRGLGRWFARWSPGRPVIELGWWEKVTLERLEITLVPARHWSRRGPFDTNRSLWGGFVVAGGGTAVYHAGDSAAFDGFAEIGRRFPGLAAAMVPVGGYRPAWFMEHNHLNPAQAGEAFLALGAATLVPMHWGAFQLTDEPLAEPPALLARWWRERGPGDGRRLAVPAVGETVILETGASARRPG